MATEFKKVIFVPFKKKPGSGSGLVKVTSKVLKLVQSIPPRDASATAQTFSTKIL
jgi:hypothetical protein